MKNILLCDDDEDIVALITLLLEKQGHHLMVVKNCESIWNAMEDTLPDLILMDLSVPEMGGENAVKLLKKDPKTRGIRVILFSAFPGLNNITGRCGADDFISKPFDVRLLKEKVEGS